MTPEVLNQEEILLKEALPDKEKVLFVDLDHTLFLNPFWSSVMPEIARRVTEEKDVSSQEIISSIRLHSRALSRTRSPHSYDWDMIVSYVLKENYNYIWQEPLEKLVKRGIASSQLLDGAKEALVAAKEGGWTIIAASQGYRRYQEPVIEYLDLDQYFFSTRFTDDFSLLKRNRAFYGPLAPGSRVVVLGDKYIDDCLYPENFNFAGIWYTGLYRDRKIKSHLKPRVEIKDLKDLGETLEQIEKDLQPVLEKEEGSFCLFCQGLLKEEEDICLLCQEVNSL